MSEDVNTINRDFDIAKELIGHLISTTPFDMKLILLGRLEGLVRNLFEQLKIDIKIDDNGRRIDSNEKEIIDNPLQFDMTLSNQQRDFYHKELEKFYKTISEQDKALSILSQKVIKSEENLSSFIFDFCRELSSLAHYVYQDAGCKENSHHYECLMKIREYILSTEKDWRLLYDKNQEILNERGC